MIQQLALAPSTAKAYSEVLRRFETITELIPGPFFSEKRVLAYASHLLNSPAYKKVSSVRTKLHQLTGAANAMGFKIADYKGLQRLNHGLSKLIQFDTTAQATPALPQQISPLILKLGEHGEQAMAALIALMWMAALRLSDALRATDQTIDVSNEPWIRLRWRKDVGNAKGKTMLSPGSPWLPILRSYLLSRKPSRHTTLLFPDLSYDKARGLLRKYSSWTAHSLRRGSLQAMARAGVPLKSIRLISGHRTDKALLTYLRLPTAELAREMVEAQLCL